MRLKIFTTIGLLFLVLNQTLLLQGNIFLQAQKPIDFAHWLLLLGVLLTLAINHVFSNNSFGNTATILTSLGAIALIGQAVIDFVWWSYGDDYVGMENLTQQLINEPSIRIPFMTIGPAFFYIGLGIHAGKLLRKHLLWTLITFAGILVIGIGSFVSDSRISIVIGHILVSIGLIALMFKKNDKLPDSKTTHTYL